MWQTYRQTDIETYRNAGIQTCTQTYSHTDIHTYRLTDIQTYRHTDLQTDIHSEKNDKQTYKHTGIQTYRHTDVQIYRHADIQTYRHTDRQTALKHTTLKKITDGIGRIKTTVLLYTTYVRKRFVISWRPLSSRKQLCTHILLWWNIGSLIHRSIKHIKFSSKYRYFILWKVIDIWKKI